jgi:UDP-N-acetylmuramyl pentapeptide synthase
MPPDSAVFVENPADAGDLVKGILRSGDAVLFKGSRGVALEKALARMEG